VLPLRRGPAFYKYPEILSIKFRPVLHDPRAAVNVLGKEE
jgi:hypothetical protein